MRGHGLLSQSFLFVADFTLGVGRGTSARVPPAAHGAPAPHQGAGVDASSSVATGQTDFDFRSGFWINLHHFLYLQAVLATPEARKGHAEFSSRDAAGTPQMSPEQRAAWAKAAGYYDQFRNVDPLRQKDLILDNYELSDAGNSSSLAGRRLAPEMRAALEGAAPVYRALWWKQHDRLNRQWIAAAAKLVGAYEGLGPRIAALYQTKWPREKTPVEVVLYANWAGAYTVTNSTLITISSVDSSDEGYASLEALFHEASHALIDRVQQGLDSRLRAADKTPTFQLVHVIIFYTAGEVILEALRRNGVREYIPYAVKNGLYTRAPDWKHYRQLCESDWQPYIDGRIGFDEALSRIARDF